MARINDFGMPFTSVAGDRSYTSADWREYFRMLAESGVVGDVGNELQVKPQAAPNKTVFVETGAILINGVIRIMESTTNLTFADNTSGSTRIDRVVARLNVNDRKIELAVLQGTPGAGAPALTRTATVHEMSLAQVTLANGYSTIGAGQITDEREDVAACGYFRYRAKPAWYPEGQVPVDAWMYANFKEQLTPAEIVAIEANSTLMSAIRKYSGHDAPASTVVEITSSQTWVVPAGANYLDIFCVGGGGAGGNGYDEFGGGGGAGRAAFISKVKVTPGQELVIQVGAGGSRGAWNGVGGSGGDTIVGGFLRASGGAGGAFGNDPPGGAGGSGSAGGGTGGSAGGDAGYPGGGTLGGSVIAPSSVVCPFTGALFGGGGGGGGAAGGSPGGGDGGTSLIVAQDGAPKSGGGGGGGDPSNTTATTGGLGGSGIVVLRYY